MEGVLKLIARETAHAKAGRPAAIVAKMNGLLDRQVTEALYTASQAGVEIDLIIRGMCSLRPGVKGVSERIRYAVLSGGFWSTAASSGSKTEARRRFTVEAPTGCHETWWSVARWCSR